MTPLRPMRIAIGDDYPIVREGLIAAIGRQRDMKLVAKAGNWPELIGQVLRKRPDIAIAELRMPGTKWPDAISAIRKHSPNTRVILFTVSDAEEHIYQALRSGARGYALKRESDCQDLLRCIRAVFAGEIWLRPTAGARLAERMNCPALTRKEKEILPLVVAGQSNKEIGAALDITEGTVKAHVGHILEKFRVAGRVAAVSVAVQRGYATLAPCSPAAGRGATSKPVETAA